MVLPRKFIKELIRECYFNTSNVMVLLEIILFLMGGLRNFNTSNVMVLPNFNICICFGYSNFNTSNVMVLQYWLLFSQKSFIYFNTSNVMVLPWIFNNTSIIYNISIHLMLWFFFRWQGWSWGFGGISIHLMLWFFGWVSSSCKAQLKFQYI